MEARKQVAELKAERAKTEEALTLQLDLADPEVEKAVTIIQAGYRGMEARKQVAEMRASRVIEETETLANIPESVSEVDYNDPEVCEAITIIQVSHTYNYELTHPLFHLLL